MRMKVNAGLDVQLMRGLGGGDRALVSQQDGEIAHYVEIYLAGLHLITAGQRELEEDLDRTQQKEPLDTFNHLSLQQNG